MVGFDDCDVECDVNVKFLMYLMGCVFVIVVFIEVLIWVGLLIGMYFKYQVVDLSLVGVCLFGLLYGIVFLVYVVVIVLVVVKLCWLWWVVLVVLVVVILLLVILLLEGWFKCCGLLVVCVW